MQIDISHPPVRPTDQNQRDLGILLGSAGAGPFGRLWAIVLTCLYAMIRVPIVVAASFTRPSDTTAYASGDLVANSTTAASVVAIPLVVARNAGTVALLRRIRLKKSGAVLTNAAFRVHFYSTNPVATAPTNGDNGAWVTINAGYLGSLDVTLDKAFIDAAQGTGVPSVNAEIPLVGDADGTVYALMEARAAYVPASAEVFTLTVEGTQS